jgi:hypothetical protein
MFEIKQTISKASAVRRSTDGTIGQTSPTNQNGLRRASGPFSFFSESLGMKKEAEGVQMQLAGCHVRPGDSVVAAPRDTD